MKGVVNIRSRLAYVSMPLVLAAIDLKLSPSRSEMKRRQKRLDSLSLIIRHSETLYDITDMVAMATNHILQLAYATTKNLFFDGNEFQGSFENDPNELISFESSVQYEFSSPDGSPRLQRPSCWQEAFVRCPRAYLLISTTVDYNLSVGQLPSANSLPDIVRELPSVGRIARLPWTSDIYLSQPVAVSQPQGYASPIEETGGSKSPSSEPGSKRGSIYTRSQQTDHASAVTSSYSSATMPLTREKEGQISDDKMGQDPDHASSINLDYMDFAMQGLPISPEPRLSSSSSLNETRPGWQGNCLEHTITTTCGESFPRYIEATDSHLFKSFFYEAFEQNWGIS